MQSYTLCLTCGSCEKALARFVALGKTNQPRMYDQHQRLLQAITMAKNDITVLERSMRAEAERPFDWLAAKMAVQ